MLFINKLCQVIFNKQGCLTSSEQVFSHDKNKIQVINYVCKNVAFWLANWRKFKFLTLNLTLTLNLNLTLPYPNGLTMTNPNSYSYVATITWKDCSILHLSTTLKSCSQSDVYLICLTYLANSSFSHYVVNLIYIYLYYNDFWLQVYCGVSVRNPNRCGDGVSPVVNSTTDTSYKQTVSLSLNFLI